VNVKLIPCPQCNAPCMEHDETCNMCHINIFARAAQFKGEDRNPGDTVLGIPPNIPDRTTDIPPENVNFTNMREDKTPSLTHRPTWKSDDEATGGALNETVRIPLEEKPLSQSCRDGLETVVERSPSLQNAKEAKILGLLAGFSVKSTGELFPIREGRNIVGSHSRCDIRIQDPKTSRKHATISAGDGSFIIDDNMSSNGTYLNGTVVREKTRLRNGDVVSLGTACYRFLEILDPSANYLR